MKKILLLTFAAFTLISCHTGRQAALQDLRKLSERIEEHAQDYDMNDWKAEVKHFEKTCKRLERHDYTVDEYHEIGRLKGECLANFAKSIIGKAGDKIMDAASQFEGLIEGVKKSIGR